MHGGIPPSLKDLEQIKRLRRPRDVVEGTFIHDLLHSEASKETATWNHVSYGAYSVHRKWEYGEGPAKDFLIKASHKLSSLCLIYNFS